MNGQNSQPFTIKRIFKTTDKYVAICNIYEGQYFQNLCRVENPDGTFNFSEKCLAQLPYHSPYFSEADSNGDPYSNANGSSDLSSLAPYRAQDNAIARYDYGQAPMPSFREFVSHYWVPMLTSIIVIFAVAMAIANYVVPIFWRRNPRSLIIRDKEGNLSIGKIKFKQDPFLGTGSKGTYVFKGTFEDSQDCAVKRIVSQTITLVDREIEFFRSLQHPNLVRYLATEKDLQFVYIALELADCTLGSLITNKKLEEFGLSKAEVCKEAAMGLQHLHKLKIVHRDLKPENILVSVPKRPNNKRYIMITDFGLSKQLTSADNYHSSHAMRSFGTQGWMPPEIIRAREAIENLKPPTEKISTEESADIFSLGCVFYYIISDGQHAFGNEQDKRDENIKADRNEVDKLVKMNSNKENETNPPVDSELCVMGYDLITAMISHDSSKRPPIDTVLKHPLFWSKKQSLQFIADVSDRLDTKERGDLARYLEHKRQTVFGYGWCKYVNESLLQDGRRTYNDKKMLDLLRLIRNKNNHFNDLSDELKQEVGHPPDEYYSYFSKRFPSLIIHVYKVMQAVKAEPKFLEYYARDDYSFPTSEIIT